MRKNAFIAVVFLFAGEFELGVSRVREISTAVTPRQSLVIVKVRPTARACGLWRKS